RVGKEVEKEGFDGLGAVRPAEIHRDHRDLLPAHASPSARKLESRASISSREMPRPKKAKRLSPWAGGSARASICRRPPTTWKRAHVPSSAWTMPLARKTG